MNGSGDLLTTATPSRLFCRKGTWVLELVKLVAVDRNVFQPRVQRLEGAEAVLQHLKRSSEHPALAAGASQLMRGFRPDEDRAFDVVDGEWVPGEPPRRDTARPSSPAPPGQANLSAELAELRAELLVLRASHERMRERVVRLEGMLIANGTPMRDLISVAPTPAVALPTVSEAPRPEAFASTLVTGQPPRASGDPRPTSIDPKPGGSGSLQLPGADEINQSLQSLGGELVAVRAARGATFSASTAGPCWASRLIDDEGGEVGVIITDLQATIWLGATLLGLDAAEIEALRAEGAPSRDVLSAMNEVANQLSGTLNQMGSNGQVRVKPIEALASGQLEWTRAPSQALTLEVEAEGGRLFLLAR